jgi:hypothetical protein
MEMLLLVSQLDLAQTLDRVLGNIIGDPVVPVAQQQKIAIATSFLVRLAWIETWPTWFGRLDVAHLGNEDGCLFDERMLTAREGTLIPRLGEERMQDGILDGKTGHEIPRRPPRELRFTTDTAEALPGPKPAQPRLPR